LTSTSCRESGAFKRTREGRKEKGRKAVAEEDSDIWAKRASVGTSEVVSLGSFLKGVR
jgi:hypothetical protein